MPPELNNACKMQQKQNRIDTLYNQIEKKSDPDTMSLINEYVDLQIEIEKDCNQ